MALKPLNSVGGFSVGEIPANVILANADIISNNLTVQKVANLGPVGNVIITGGAANQYLQTDGAGNLTWTTADTSRILNGNSNVSIPSANGNVEVSVAGNSNIAVFTGTGANITGYFTVSGNLTSANANLGNLVTANFANFTNDVVVQGNIANANNISVTNALSANTGNFSGNITSLNANLGNLATANYVNVSQQINGNVGNFSGNVTASNTSAGNLLTANFANIASNTITNNLEVNLQLDGNTANFDGNVAALGVFTDNLYHANGSPWDFQQPAGANTEIQYNDGAGGFGASSKFTFDYAGNVLTVDGNANVTNTLIGNVANFSGNLTSANANLGNLAQANFVNVSTNVNVTGTMQAGNVRTDNLLYANGNPWDLQEAAGSNTEIQYNMGDDFAASANFTYNDTTQVFKVTGNANITNTVITPNVNSLTGNLTLTANGFNTVLDNSGNAAFPGNVTAHTFYGNVNANITVTAANTSVLYSDAGLISGANGFTFDKVSNTFSTPGDANVVGNLLVQGNANIANINITPNFITGDGTGIVLKDDTNGAQLEWNSNAYVYVDNTGASLEANAFIATLDFAGDFSLPNNLSVVGNIANANNISVTNALDANTGNFSGNITSLNANLGNLVQGNFVNVASNVLTSNLTVNLELSGNTANFSGNVIVPNLSVNSHIAGNTANFTGNVVLSGGNVTVNNQFYGNTANFSGNITSLNATLGNLADANYIRTGELMNGNSNIVIAPNGNISLSATGTANVFVLSNVGANITGYVTANGNGTFGALYSNTLTAQGGNLTVYAAAGNNYVELRPTGSGHVDVGNFKIQSLGAPTASSDAATKQYVDDIAQGLHVHAPCYTATSNTLAVLTGGTITYNNGTAGVGANLVLSGSPTANYLSANVFDGNTQAVVGSRILVYKETNLAYNGIYVVDSATVLTRATDFDTPTEMAGGDFTFVQNGDDYNDTGWVMTDPVTTVGTSPVIFVQFSGAGTYQAGAGLTLTGTVFSVNVDNLTTEIAGGNVVVKANAQLTTPNIGAATGTSLNLTGNVLADNLNANALVTAANVNVTSNVLANNFSANSNITSNNATINLALTGNTANFSGNVIVPNLTVNTTLSGNVANFTGNLTAANGNLGNLITANFANIASNTITNNLTVNLELAGNTANFSGNIVAGNISTSGSGGNITGANVVSANTFSGNLVATYANATGNITGGNLVTAGVANVAQLNVTGNVTSDLLPNANLTHDLGNATLRWDNVYAGNIDASGNLTIGGNLSSNNYTANIITANSYINVGNTAIRHGQVTTTAITANQAISTVAVSGITGIEWVVKGLDSAGSGKYSMAIVTAVTDGTTVDYSTFGGVTLGSTTGTLAVNIVGSNVELQVTPSSSNSTVWVTQYRTI